MSDDDLSEVWKALADPTRRALLDLLHQQPQTTGQLAEHFTMSRFGVMKHLQLLESANLVVVRRHGRQRWNHLNSIPIRRIYQRWVGKYADKTLTEQGQQYMSNNTYNFAIAQEVVINAPREAVWKALTTDIHKWWAFHIGEEGSKLSLEAKLGGHFSERWNDQDGAIWGTVTYIKQGFVLRLEGALGFMGPGTNKYSYELEERSGSTLLKLSHHSYGGNYPETKANYTQGWNHLLNRCLKAWLEEGKTYDQVPPMGS